MKIKRTISILVLVCFFFTSVVVQPQKQAEAVVPIVAILVDAAVCAAISAGVTYAIPKIEKHVAGTQIAKMSDMERRALEIEGGLSEMTVADAKRLGIKTKPGAKRIFKVKGAGKAALISGALSLGITGINYAIDYYSQDDLGDCEGITKEKERLMIYAEGYCSGERTYLINTGLTTNDKLPTRDVYLSCSEGVEGVILYNYIAYGDNYNWMIKNYDNTVRYHPNWQVDGVTSNWIAMSFDLSKDRNIYRSCSGWEMVSYNSNNNSCSLSVYVTGEGNYTLGEGIEQYHYTGTVPAEDIAVTDSPYINTQRERLEQAKDDDKKIIYLIQNTDGSVDVETSTELEDGTEIVDLSPGEDGPIIPDDPSEGDKPDLSKLYGVITTRWPFSLPWDIGYLINLVICEPLPPRWEFTLPESMGEHTLVIDMAQYEDIMNIVRWFITFGFCFGIVLVIRKLYGGSV